MAYTPATKPSVGEATKKSLIDLIIDNQADLNARADLFSSYNQIINASFENFTGNDPDGWTMTDFTGGSHGPSVTFSARHGTKSLVFTSTSTANGGGEAESTDFFPVNQNTVYYWGLERAVTLNMSYRVRIIWYDHDGTFLSNTDLVSAISATNNWTLDEGSVTPPANADQAKMEITGGVPGVGTTASNAFFDNVRFWPIQTREMVSTAQTQANFALASGVSQAFPSGSVSAWATGTGGTTNLEIFLNAAWRVVGDLQTNALTFNSNGAAYRATQSAGFTSTVYYLRLD